MTVSSRREASSRAKGLRVEQLVAAEHAAREAAESAARWWQDLAANSASARTNRALDKLLRTSFVTMKSALQADAVSVLVANEAGDELVARASNGLSEEVTLGLGIRFGEGMSGRVIANRKPLLVDDLSKIEVVSPVLRHSGLRSVAAVPILFEDRPLGVLYVGSRELAHFDTVDLELLELMAERLAVAVERVRAFESERSARARAERDADHLARLQAITSQLAAALSAEAIASTLTGALNIDASGRTDAAWSSLWLRQDGRLELVETPAGPVPTGSLRSLGRDLDGPLAKVARTGEALFLEDGSHPLELEQGQAPCWAALPLLVRGVCLGVMIVVHRENTPFEQDERDFLRAVADQAAQAFDNARLLGDQVALAEANSFLAQAAKAMAEGSGFKDTLDRLASLVLGVVGDICLIDVTEETGGLRRMVARHRDKDMQALVDRLSSDVPDLHGSHPAVEVIRTGTTRWSAEMSDSFLKSTTRDQAHYALVKALKFRSYVTVPLVGRTGVLGSLTVVSVTRALGRDDVSFTERLAGHVAAVVDNARRYEATLQTSQVLQQSLLPRSLPEIAGLKVAFRYLPATRGLEVGGDFYDLVVLPGGSVAFMIGDVAGHDRDAAALMGQLRSAARVLVAQVDGPAALIEALQQGWGLLGFDRIATALFALLEPACGELTIASAGHERPLLVERGRASYLDVEPSPALGVTAGRATNWHGGLQPGQTLLLYTDGAIEERGIDAEHGLERLSKAAADGSSHPESVCDRVVATLPADRHDDIALFALEREDLLADPEEPTG